MRVVRALHETVEGFLDEGFVLGVNAGEGLVEDQYRSVFEEGPGDGDALSLAAGEPDGALADIGIVALGKLGDELVGVGGSGGSFKLFPGGVLLAESKVVGDGAMEEVGVLGDDGDVLTDVVEGEVSQVLAT